MFSAGKIKTLNTLLLISFFFGYLEWGTNQHAFIFQAESEIFMKIFSAPQSVIHPFVLIPLAGQVILLYLIITKTVRIRLNYIAVISLSAFMGFLFIIGILSRNLQIFLSTLPFLSVMLMLFRQLKMISKSSAGTKA